MKTPIFIISGRFKGIFEPTAYDLNCKVFVNSLMAIKT